MATCSYEILGPASRARAPYGLALPYPPLFDTETITDAKLRQKLQEKLAALDVDQVTALEGLRDLPAGVMLLPEGTGAGKTTWSLLMIVLAQAGATKCKALYMMDINKPLGDAANDLHRTYRALGMSRKVIRMYKWPVEVEKDIEHRGLMAAVQSSLPPPNFAMAFVQHVERWQKLALYEKEQRALGAPTLDEAAFEYYEENRAKYSRLDSLMKAYHEGEDVKTLLNKELTPNYSHVLRNAATIMCTPVASRCHFNNMFSPDLIIFDECAHARELSTLIPVAFFQPMAWLFIGDPWQRTPYTSMADHVARWRREHVLGKEHATRQAYVRHGYTIAALHARESREP
jgi:hypothetical protein